MQEREANLAERTALVTGAGRGIGRAVALALAAAGARIAVAARTVSEIEEVAESCRATGHDAIALPFDVTDRQACDAAVARCEERWGRLDILVSNAGIAPSRKFLEIDDALWSRVLQVNLTPTFYLVRAALPGMLQRQDGRVIAMGSIAAKVGAAYIAPYSAAKHGLLGLMRSLAAEYPRSGVTFNTVCPAYVDTPLTAQSLATIMEKTGRSRDQALAVLYTPQGRLIEPQEVAALCVLLAGPSGRSINGQAINVDGGQVPW